MENEKKKSKTIILIVIILVLLLVVGFLAFKLLNKPSGKDSSQSGISLNLDPNQQDTETKKKGKSVPITLPGWDKIIITKDTTDIKEGINFYNPEKNGWYVCPECDSVLDEDFICTNEDCGKKADKDKAEYRCYYVTFALYLKENDELLYQSGLVEAGKSIKEITLSRPLEAGEYDAYVFMQPYRPDKTTTNNGKVPLTLKVK